MWHWTKRITLAFAALVMIVIALTYRADIAPDMLRQKYANAQSDFIRVEPGLTAHVRDQGDTRLPVLVLIHGSNSSLHTWEPWVAKLKSSHRVITIDMPGHGLTGPHPRNVYGGDDFAAVVDAVVRAKNIDRFVLGGNSMGGWISWRYALLHPDKIQGLILVDAGGAPLDAQSKRELPLGFRLAMTPVIRDIAIKLTPRAMVEKSVHQTVSVQSSVTPQVVDRYWDLLRYPGNREATATRFARGFDDSSFDKISTLRMPTLILWGREDRLIPVSTAARFAAKLPNDKTIIYDRVGHIPMEEIPDLSATDVLAWLDSLNKLNATTPI
jgi:pimeloyl-ACP methyl ester carboxylesterase